MSIQSSAFKGAPWVPSRNSLLKACPISRTMLEEEQVLVNPGENHIEDGPGVTRHYHDDSAEARKKGISAHITALASRHGGINVGV